MCAWRSCPCNVGTERAVDLSRWRASAVKLSSCRVALRDALRLASCWYSLASSGTAVINVALSRMGARRDAPRGNNALSMANARKPTARARSQNSHYGNSAIAIPARLSEVPNGAASMVPTHAHTDLFCTCNCVKQPERETVVRRIPLCGPGDHRHQRAMSPPAGVVPPPPRRPDLRDGHPRHRARLDGSSCR